MPNLISYYDSPTTSAINQPVKQLTWVDTTGVTIDCSTGNAFDLTINGTSGTITMANAPTSSRYGFELHLNWMAGSITWPISWNKGDALPTTTGGYVITGVSVDGGNSFKIAVMSGTDDIIQDGLVLHLDAGNLSSYPGTGTTWTDLAGSNDGTLTNGPTYSGANGGSIVFDGTNDYSAHSTTLDVTAGVTFAVWVKRNGNGSGDSPNTVVSKWWDGATRCFNITASGTEYKLVYRASGQGADTGLTVADTTLTGNWAHLVFTVDGSTGKAYKNGNETLSTSVPGHLTNNNAQLRIASYVHITLNGFANCSISQFLFYNRALTASEITQNFEATRGRFDI